MKKESKVLLVVFMIIILIVIAITTAILISITGKNASIKNAIEVALEKRYNKDFEVISIERESRELTGTFFQKFRQIAVVREKDTGRTFLARKNEDDDIVEDKYYESLFGNTLKTKLDRIIAKYNC